MTANQRLMGAPKVRPAVEGTRKPAIEIAAGDVIFNGHDRDGCEKWVTVLGFTKTIYGDIRCEISAVVDGAELLAGSMILSRTEAVLVR